MNIETVKIFFFDLSRRPDLLSEFQKAIADNLPQCRDVINTRIVKFGEIHGYGFTINDLVVFYHNVRTDSGAALNDTEMAHAAGGTNNSALNDLLILMKDYDCLL